MKFVNLKNFCMLVCAIVFSSALFAEGIDQDQLVAQQQRSRNNNGNNGRNPNSWKPYYLKTKDTEPITCFYQQTVGVGFLYFSGIKGNLIQGTTGSATIGTPLPKSDTKLSGHIGYNRTPVAEFIIGRDVWHWMKIAMSYTHQGGIVAQTRPQRRATINNTNPDLTAHVRLDAMLFRVYFMFPYTLVWKGYYYEPYFSAGVGPGWQTWADIKSEANFTNALRMKVSANCVFTIDFGAKLRKAMPTYVMSFTLGCKYTEWGQSRSMGKYRQQYIQSTPTNGTDRQFLNNPLRITTLYSFAPYVGVQFNF